MLTLQVSLDARDVDLEFVLVRARNTLATISEVVVASHIQDVGEDVVGLNDKVTDHDISIGAGELNVRNWDVADGIDDVGNDDVSKILEKMGLEFWLAVTVVAEIVEEPVHGLGKRLVVRVLVELLTEELELLNDTIGVIPVALAQEEVALVVKLVVLLGGLVLEDEALLLQALANVGVEVLEETSELGVFVGVTVDLVDRVEEIIHGSAVGEALKHDLHIGQRKPT